MTFVRIKGFHIYKDRHGKMRCYHRKSGQAIDLQKTPIGTAEFLAECERIGAMMTIAKDPKPGTLGGLIKAFRKHDDYLRLAQRTRDDYDRCFDYLEPIYDTLLSRFTTPLIVNIRDKAGKKMGWKWGTYVKTCLSLVFNWGMEHGFNVSNPARQVKGLRRPKDAPDTNPPWPDEVRNATLAALHHEDPLALPLHLMVFCGIDPGDVISLPKSAIKGGFLDTARNKTGQPVWVPLPQPVLQCLSDAPAHNAITLCASSRGTPWTKSGLDSAWAKFRTKHGLQGKLTLKGLRHTVATILAELGYDERTIADMLGQKTIEMARHYSKRADKRQKMGAVVKSLSAEMERRGLKNGT